MYTVTYSLRENRKDSEKYYSDVAAFTEEVLKTGEELFQNTLDAYLSWMINEKPMLRQTKEEAVLELLILGVLWRVYSGDSECLDAFPEGLLIKLSDMRNNSEPLKPGINFLKGIFSTLFLSPDLYDNLNIAQPGLEALDKLLKWLSATDEFNQEVKHLVIWQGYLKQLSAAQAVDIIASAITFALWFEESSEQALGRYTANVEQFLNEIRPKHYWREDVIFCGRRRVEYHMNMVGAELMNRAFRPDFMKTEKKLLILPTCMRLHGEGKCKAVQKGSGLICARCNPYCEVSRLSLLGEELGYQLIIIAHGSSISAQKNNAVPIDESTGVVGVSCILNLISGGWMLKEMGIPAQCVLLDYCGCKAHWHDEGLPTVLNMEKLKRIF